MTPVDDARRAGDDPFVKVLEWVITGYGYDELLQELARIKRADGDSVDRRTLDDWRRGDYPKKYTSTKIDVLHRVAKSLPGYPPPHGSGPSLTDLSGPNAKPPPAESSVPAPGSASRLDASTHPEDRRTKRWTVGTAMWAIGGVAVLAIGLVTGRYLFPDGAGREHQNQAESGTRTLPPRPGLVIEVAAGKGAREVPVYSSPQGAAAPAQVSSRIPYGTPVYVRCRTPNAAKGFESVAGFYLIVGGPWDGLYAVSNGFTNGDPLGTQGGHDLDMTVPQC